MEKTKEKQLKQGQICFTSQFHGREGMPVGATPAFGIRSLYQGLITLPDLEANTADQPGPGVALEPPICIYHGARNTNNVVSLSEYHHQLKTSIQTQELFGDISHPDSNMQLALLHHSIN